jgi:anti-sigma factor RsiW
MKHQQYETWILLDTELDQEQHRELQAHLKQCASCLSLFQAVHQLDHLFKTTPQPQPQPAFSARWMERVEKRERRRNQLFLGIALVVISLATVVLLSSVGIGLRSAADGFPRMLLEMVSMVANWIVVITQISNILTPLFRVSIKLISPAWLFTMGISLIGITAAWIYAVSQSRSLQKEIQL